MAKRFTDTQKWGKPWIRKLRPVDKCFLFYLWDTCSPAGIWTVDFETAEYYIGAKLARVNPFPADFPIVELEGGQKWLMPTFVAFQQPNGLSATNRAHLGIIRDLEKYGIDWKGIGSLKGLPSPMEGAQVLVKVKVKDIKEEKDKSFFEKPQEIMVRPEIWHLWSLILDECPVIFEMKKPLTEEQLYSMALKYPFEKIMAVFRAMANRPTLTKDYVSANLTAKNWLARDAKPEDRPMIKREQPAEPPPDPAQQEKMLMKSVQDLYALSEKGEDITARLNPGLYNFIISKGWVIAVGNAIIYKDNVIANKIDIMKSITVQKDEKKDLTLGAALSIFGDAKQQAKALTVGKIFEAFKKYGTPW